ncbi:MAG: oxidoreductase [Bacteroidetes bacterium]|jgi:predicted oxidoreductase|nr:oxidoreductase [Bacteroidota bacterium]
MVKSDKRIRLHKKGPELSAFASGMWRLHEWNFKTDDLHSFIEDCISLGVTTFDHADIYGDYGNESLFGKVLTRNPAIRDKIEIVTKCGICLPVQNRPEYQIQHYNTSVDHLRESVERSLRNLKTDYLDLVLIHRPDPLMHAESIINLFLKLKEEGKVLHFGVSNFTPSQFSLFQSFADLPLVTNQVEFSLSHLNPIYDGTFDQLQAEGSSPMLWSPFAGGELFYSDSERMRRIRKAASAVMEKTGATLDQVALAWYRMLPVKPLPVLGTGKIERVKSAIHSLDIKLERQDWYRLLEASNGHPVP